MKCQDFRELIDSYLSDELLTETNHDVLRHMEDCADCRNVIKARRQVRAALKSAVINAPQYQIGKNFEYNLKTRLRDEALKETQTKSYGWFGFNPAFAVTAGLILAFAFGFLFINDFEDSTPAVFVKNSHTIPSLPANHLTNIALGDHEFCAVGHDGNEPVTLAETPAKYEKIDGVVMSPLKNTISKCELIASHTCRYKDTDFTHLIVEKDNKILSVMITDLKGKENVQKNQEIVNLSSDKYQVARFDLKYGAVFVISDLDKRTNMQAAQAIINPLQEHFKKDNSFVTTKAMFLAVY